MKNYDFNIDGIVEMMDTLWGGIDQIEITVRALELDEIDKYLSKKHSHFMEKFLNTISISTRSKLDVDQINMEFSFLFFHKIHMQVSYMFGTPLSTEGEFPTFGFYDKIDLVDNNGKKHALTFRDINDTFLQVRKRMIPEFFNEKGELNKFICYVIDMAYLSEEQILEIYKGDKLNLAASISDLIKKQNEELSKHKTNLRKYEQLISISSSEKSRFIEKLVKTKKHLLSINKKVSKKTMAEALDMNRGTFGNRLEEYGIEFQKEERTFLIIDQGITI